MRVAISTDGENVSAHFGRCPEFTLVDIDNGEVSSKERISNPGHEPGFLPVFLHAKGVQSIIAGGMGHRAKVLFAEQNIEAVVGVTGSVDEVIGSLASGTLKGGESLCRPGDGKGYGVEKSACDHGEDKNC